MIKTWFLQVLKNYMEWKGSVPADNVTQKLSNPHWLANQNQWAELPSVTSLSDYGFAVLYYYTHKVVGFFGDKAFKESKRFFVVSKKAFLL